MITHSSQFISNIFANGLHNVLSENCNFVRKLSFLLYIVPETEQLKNSIHSLATSYYVMTYNSENARKPSSMIKLKIRTFFSTAAETCDGSFTATMMDDNCSTEYNKR